MYTDCGIITLLYVLSLYVHYVMQREHYTPESEMFRPVSSRTPKVTGSEGNRRGWLRRLFSGWRWPWSRPRSVSEMSECMGSLKSAIVT